MSSDPVAGAVVPGGTGRCPFCNVACPVRVTRAGPGTFAPDYVPQEGYAGLCARGSVLADLLDHADRHLEARRRDGAGSRRVPLDEAARDLAQALRQASRAAVLVDGTCDVATLAAVGRLASECGARWAVHVPPGDAGLVHGLDGAGVPCVGPDRLAEAQALLIVGNAYASHPVVAHWTFEARGRHPRMPVYFVGDASGVTAEFATERYQPRLAVGETARVLAAVRTGDGSPLGPEGAPLAAWKKHLPAGRTALLVGADLLGYRDGLALAAEAARLAADLGAAVCPLTTYGNAWGALRVAAAAGATTVEDLLADRPQTLVVIGTDLLSALGRQAVRPAWEAATQRIYVGPMPNSTSAATTLVLPAAFPFETAGRMLAGPGRELAFDPVLTPPAGVPTVRELVALAGIVGEAAVDLSVPVAGPRATAAVETPERDGLRLALAADPFHFDDGSLTRQAAWPRTVRPRPVLVLSEADAEAAGVADGGRALVDGPGGVAEVEVHTSAAQRPGQARASAAFAEVRDALGWTWKEAPPGEPVHVRLRKP